MKKPRKKLQVVFWTPFNRALFRATMPDKAPVHPTYTGEWNAARYKIWKNTALRSIQAQTFQDFTYLFCCNPETEPILNDLWDVKDKRVVLQFSGTDRAQAVLKRLNDVAKNIITIRLDSDDLYHPEVAEECVACRSIAEWMVFKSGYAFRESSGHMWNYDVGGSGPFFAHSYKDNQFIKKEMNEFSHAKIKGFQHTTMSTGKFIVSITGMNTTTFSTNTHIKRKIFEPQKSWLLSKFGVKL